MYINNIIWKTTQITFDIKSNLRGFLWLGIIHF